MEPIFISARDKFTCPQLANNESTEEEISNKEQIILHLEYHLNDVPVLRKSLENYVMNVAWICCQKPTNKGGLGIKKTIIAYYTQYVDYGLRNIRETTQKAKLHQHPGKEVSTLF